MDDGDILYQPATLVPVGVDLFTEDNQAGRVEDPPELGGTD